MSKENAKKLNRGDRKILKKQMKSLSDLLILIKLNEYGLIDFEWVKLFEASLFNEKKYANIIPILRVLRRLALTDHNNSSLRTVCTKKLYEIKQRLIENS